MIALIVPTAAHNLKKLVSFFRGLGFETKIGSDTLDVLRATVVILPGVGNYGIASESLQGGELRKALIERSQESGKTLGICLGAQLMLQRSEESDGGGLGQVPGIVRRLSRDARTPHHGWSEVTFSGWEADPTIASEWFYFSHSFFCDVGPEVHVLGHFDHGGIAIPALFRYRNYIGLQFHPESSGQAGVQLIKRLLLMGDEG